MQTVYILEIKGRPVPYALKKDKFGRIYNARNKEKKIYQKELKRQFNLNPIKKAVRIDLTFCFTPPRSWSVKRREEAIQGIIEHEVKPDRDNLIKFIGDCMTGIVYLDDAQVNMGWVGKLYGKEDLTLIEIYTKDLSA